MKIRIIHYFIRFIINPFKATEEIKEDEKGIWSGFWFIFAFSVGYSITVLVAYLQGHQPASNPLMIIPLEKWYLVQTFTTIPVSYAGFLAYAGLAYLVSKAMGGKGSFDATFASQSYTMYIPSLILHWVPETFYFPFLVANGVTSFPWPGWIEQTRVFIVPFSWILVLSVIALTKVHKIHFLKSICVVVVASIPMSMVMAAFIR
ncbi:MAG: YIP1 family protein [Spirochaetota bacterium]|nr:MAG: YIP1 family protein [Spirochaetota bacterium]